jgi:multicomponent Na+:H+ antiporter subunit A
LLGLIPLAAAFLYASMIPLVSAGGVVEFRREWVPSLGLALDLRIDGLSLLFLLLISGIGVFVTWYAAGYLHGKKDLGRFYLYLFGFMGSMLGVVSSDHLVAMFVFWELTSISSYLLIGYYHTAPRSRASALQALLVTGTGGLAMLAGMLLLGRMAGTFRISELNALDAVRLVSEPGFPVVLLLILLGAFTKSAQFPFHFWLPNAMEAPAPVSSYLHSATMVKAGVFLLARLHPLLSASPLWIPIVAPVGAVTMMIGVVMGLGQRDLKKILALNEGLAAAAWPRDSRPDHDGGHPCAAFKQGRLAAAQRAVAGGRHAVHAVIHVAAVVRSEKNDGVIGELQPVKGVQ